MGFIETFLKKPPLETITRADLETFVSRRVPEGLNVEYKEKDALEHPDRLARVIASFANSDGGLFVLGVSERREGTQRLPEDITWDSDAAHTPEWIETMLVNRIRPPIIGVRIAPVRNETGGMAYLVDVPASPTAPHMAPDGLYYYRRNFSIVPMEHYQVADAFGKRRRPVIRPLLSVSRYNAEGRSLQLNYGLANISRTLAKWTMVHMVLVGCTVMKEERAAFWENIRVRRASDGLDEWLVTHESPVSALHPDMMTMYGPITLQLTSPLVLVTLLVGAEDAPTETYVAMFGQDWLAAKGATTDPEKELTIETLTVGEELRLDNFLRIQEELASDVNATNPEVLRLIGGRLMNALGPTILLLMTQLGPNHSSQEKKS